MDLVFIPINHAFHWSLCVLISPDLLKRKMNSILGGAKNMNMMTSVTMVLHPNSGSECCLLFMDSLHIHPTETFAKVIKDYLYYEWEMRLRNLLHAKQTDSNSANYHALFLNAFDTIHPPIPTQRNGYDCGVYVIKFVQNLLRMWCVSPISDLAQHLTCIDFTQHDVDEERVKLLSVLKRIRKDFVRVRNLACEPSRINSKSSQDGDYTTTIDNEIGRTICQKHSMAISIQHDLDLDFAQCVVGVDINKNAFLAMWLKILDDTSDEITD